MLGQLLDEINTADGYGVLLLAQMDGVPDTLQFIVATTALDESGAGLRDKNRYIVRALGVQEHRVSVGLFKAARTFDGEDHPLLLQYNSTPTGLFFRGQPQNVEALILNIFQTYSQVFGDWRHVPDYLNLSKPLLDLFGGGGDLVGEMPAPLASALDPAFVAQGLETKHITGEKPKEQPPQKLLLLDDSYVVAMDFSVDLLGKA